MKKYFPWILTGCFAAWVLSSLTPAPEKDGFHVNQFGKLPVLLNGRVQPFDSVARNSLLSIHGTQTVRPAKDATNKKILTATEWLLETMTRPEDCDNRKIFRIENRELQPFHTQDFPGELKLFRQSIATAVAAVKKGGSPEKVEENDVRMLGLFLRR